MFERFTERARQVVVLAQEEARFLHNDYIGVEHLLLGLFAEEDSLAAQVLTQNLKLNPDDIRDKVSPNKDLIPIGGEIPFTRMAKKTLELALREALGMGHNYIGTEHILLACLHEVTPPMEAVFSTLGDNWAEVIRLEVTEMLRGPSDKPVRPIRDTDLKSSEREELKLKDVLADVLTGYKMWKETKGRSEDEEWTDADEAFRRWIDGSNVTEFL